MFPYITGEQPAVGDVVLYSDKSKFGNTYNGYNWTARSGAAYNIYVGFTAEVVDIQTHELGLRFSAFQGEIIDIDPRLFELVGRVMTAPPDGGACGTKQHAAQSPPPSACICGIQTIMATGCICGSIQRYVAPKTW